MAPRHGRVRAALVLGAALAAGLPQMALRSPLSRSSRARSSISTSALRAGGTYDYFGRMVARFIGKHIPGNPTVVAQTMHGAGSLQLANFMFAQAPRDGTAMGDRHPDGCARGGAAFAGRALQGRGVHLDRPDDRDPRSRSSPGRRRRPRRSTTRARIETPVAGTGAGSPSEGYPKLLNALAGTQVQDHLRLPRLDPGHAGGGARRGRRRVHLLEYAQAHQAGLAAQSDINVLVQCAARAASRLARHADRCGAREHAGGTPDPGLLYQQRRGRPLDARAAWHSRPSG